jgi:CHAT domain-containing protein/Tfp pilus assembly protein PilF
MVSEFKGGLAVRLTAVQKKRVVISAAVMLSASPMLLSGADPRQSAASLAQGVRVQEIQKDSAAEAAGLQVDDVIEAWSRDTRVGNIRSPFDWVEVFNEQAPRGTMTLRGLRANQPRQWSLEMPGRRGWGLTVEPLMRLDLMPSSHQCWELGQAGKNDDASQCWRSLLEEINSTDPPWVRPWLLSRVAESLTKQHWQVSDEAYREAVDRSTAAGPEATAQVLTAWAIQTENRRDLTMAEAYYNEALAIREKLAPDSLAVATVLSSLGHVALDRNDPAKAGEYYSQVLAIREKLAPDSLSLAGTLNNLGVAAKERGDLVKAETYYRQALTIKEKAAPGSLDVADSLTNLGILAETHGNLASAEEFYSRALAIYEIKAPGSSGVAWSLNNLGVVARNRGNLAKAEEYYRRALTIREKRTPGSNDVATSLNNLGVVASNRGDLTRAEEYYRQALAIQEKWSSNSPDVAGSLNNLGVVARNRGNLAEAEDYYGRALAINEKRAPGSIDVAESLNNLGVVARERGDLTKATEHNRQALAIFERLAPGSLRVATTLHNLGLAAQDRSDLGLAEGYFRQALAIDERLAPDSRDHAEVLYSLGVISGRNGRVGEASVYFSRAIDAVESQIARLGGGLQIQAGFRAARAPYYQEYLETLLGLKEPERAFLVSERARARSLLEMLAERDVVFGKDVPPDIQQARKANARAYDRAQNDLSKLNPTKDAERIEQLHTQLRELSAEREQLVERLRQVSPRFADLHYPQPLDVAATRRALDTGTTLLSYAVGKEQTVLFVVQPVGHDPGLSVFTLPVTAKTLRAEVEAFRALLQDPGATDVSALTTQGRALYEQLLRPAEALLAPSTRLVVVPEGPLHLLPFAALRRSDQEYVVDWKPVHTVVSATVYAELQKRRGHGAKPVELVAFGDPAYPQSDQAAAGRPADAEVRSAVDRGMSLARLPFSRQEADRIAALYPERSQKYVGAEATEERAKAVGSEVRYIHFAVHGLLDERFPMNSALALTLPEEAVEGRDNGLLQAWEILEQMRVDADLITLSACESGLGQELNGEGLIGLTRAFQYAGARSVLASLWKVNDFWTMQLMTRVYRELRAGRSKDEALRLAQLELRRSRRASHPYYWAAFSLTGDWQ